MIFIKTKTMSKTIHKLPIVEPRESTITIEHIRTRLSSIKNDGHYFEEESIFNAEVFLCLANEINDLKEELRNIKKYFNLNI